MRFSDRNPIGKRIDADLGGWMTIVGVVGDVKQAGLTKAVMIEVYAPHAQVQLSNAMSLVVSSSSDPTTLVAAIRRETHALDPAQQIYNVKTMETVIAESVSDRRLNMVLLGVLSGLSLLLTVIQSATRVPVFLLSLPAGVVADKLDRLQPRRQSRSHSARDRLQPMRVALTR